MGSIPYRRLRARFARNEKQIGSVRLVFRLNYYPSHLIQESCLFKHSLFFYFGCKVRPCTVEYLHIMLNMTNGILSLLITDHWEVIPKAKLTGANFIQDTSDHIRHIEVAFLIFSKCAYP